MSRINELRERILDIIYKNLSETDGGVILSIRIDSDPSENYLLLDHDEIVFKTREYSNVNRANSALIGYLSRSLKIPSSRIDIVYGARSNSVKKVLFKEVKPEELGLKLIRILRLI
ncbi:MAG: DUF167 family protein [Desulfurococcaceae archaeon]